MGQIYKGIHTGEFVVVSCRVGLRMVRGQSTLGMAGCCDAGCACAAEDVRFVKASPEQAEGFLRCEMETADRRW